MEAPAEVLGTDLFREEHRSIANKLHEIDAELTKLRDEKPSWRSAAPTFRRLLVLLEVDLLAQTEREEHALYSPLHKTTGVLSPTLAACYREHGHIRVDTEALHHQLLRAYSGEKPVPDALFEQAGTLIEMVLTHLAREDEVLFLAAEQELPHAELLHVSKLEARHVK